MHLSVMHHFIWQLPHTWVQILYLNLCQFWHIRRQEENDNKRKAWLFIWNSIFARNGYCRNNRLCNSRCNVSNQKEIDIFGVIILAIMTVAGGRIHWSRRRNPSGCACNHKAIRFCACRTTMIMNKFHCGRKEKTYNKGIN